MIASNDWMTVNTELERMQKETILNNFRYYIGIFLEVLKETTETSGYWVSPPKFEPGTSRIQLGSATAWVTLLGLSFKEILLYMWIRMKRMSVYGELHEHVA
jgi:hypothetical protein